VLDGWYPGIEGGTAIAEALLGEFNPGGKLTFTWPKELKDSPTYSIGTADKDNVDYKEGVFVGYRYFDTRKVAPQFPFGFGLSYSRFSFSGLSMAQFAQGVHVSLDVKNVSKRLGSEVVQLYVAPSSSPVPRPSHELRGFQKITLDPGEVRRVSFDLDSHSFRHWDVTTHKWKIDPGDYEIQVGDSSRNLPLDKHIVFSGSKGAETTGVNLRTSR
jgi:beta-glucosidase